MSMYRSMQNTDTPDLPFAQSVMELATLQSRQSQDSLSIAKPRIYTGSISDIAFKPKPQGWNRPSQAEIAAAKLEAQYQDSLSIAKPKVSTGLLALAGVLLLA